MQNLIQRLFWVFFVPKTRLQKLFFNQLSTKMKINISSFHLDTFHTAITLKAM